jgi:uncharacterized protein (DUF1810 family)
MAGMDEPFDLQRFVSAQDADGTFDAALRELRRGRKESHWMWFVFPQVAGLGRSATARFYELSGLAEAAAYVAHPVLGPRLQETARAMLELRGDDAELVLGPIDGAKLRSSMTLFALAAPDEPVFREVLEKYFGGGSDPATISRL